jgi:hypothetical protein
VVPQLLGRGWLEPTESVRSIAASGFPLGVKCNFCLHRALLDEKALQARFDKPRLMSSLRFRCTRCGKRDFHLEKFWSRASVTRFMRSDD